jgi:hypothetical protein
MVMVMMMVMMVVMMVVLDLCEKSAHSPTHIHDQHTLPSMPLHDLNPLLQFSDLCSRLYGCVSVPLGNDLCAVKSPVCVLSFLKVVRVDEVSCNVSIVTLS